MPDEIGVIESQHTKKWPVWVAVLIVIILAGGWYARGLAVPYFIEKARIALNDEDAVVATKNLNMVLKLDPRNPVAYAYLGHITLGLDNANPESDTPFPSADFVKAIEYYEKALSLGLATAKNRGVYKQSLEFAGYSYWSQKEYDKAVGKYLEQIEQFPDDSFWARYLTASDYFNRSNKPVEALEILTMAPNSLDASKRVFGDVYTLLTRLSSYFGNSLDVKQYAALAIDNAVDKKSTNVQIAYLNIAIQLAKEKNLAKALGEYKKAEAIHKDSSVCTLSNIYFFNSDYIKAIEIAKEKIASITIFDYPSSTCIEVLARSYLAKNNKIESKKYLEQYMNITNAFKDKNVYVMRNREAFQKILDDI